MNVLSSFVTKELVVRLKVISIWKSVICIDRESVVRKNKEKNSWAEPKLYILIYELYQSVVRLSFSYAAY